MRFKFKVKQWRYVDATVDANNLEHARECAAKQVACQVSTPFNFDAQEPVQIDGPWVSSVGWYDLHGPEDLIVVERSVGNRFTQLEVDILKERLKAMKLQLADWWNGVDCSSISFRCRGRKSNRPMSKKQLAILLAPLEFRK
mgnify:CR=1 FL=1